MEARTLSFALQLQVMALETWLSSCRSVDGWVHQSGCVGGLPSAFVPDISFSKSTWNR
jgi:hypothetical protein